MKFRSRLGIVLAAVLVGGGLFFLPLMPTTRALTLPIYYMHGCSGVRCQSDMPYSIHGTTSLSFLLLGVGSPPYSNPYEFETNNTLYAVAFVGTQSPEIFASDLNHPFVKSPFVFSSLSLKANAASFNGSELIFTVRNEGATPAICSIDVANGWRASIPYLAPGATYTGNSTGWIPGPPSVGTAYALVVAGFVDNQTTYQLSLSVIDVVMT